MKAKFKQNKLTVTIETEKEREDMANWKEYMEDCTLHPYLEVKNEGMEYIFYV